MQGTEVRDPAEAARRLEAELRRIDAEENQLRAEGQHQAAEADQLEVAAVLRGEPIPETASELRAQAAAGQQRIAAIGHAKEIGGKALESLQQLANAQACAAQTEKIRAADRNLDAAHRALDAVMAQLVDGLAALRDAAKVAKEERAVARSMGQSDALMAVMVRASAVFRGPHIGRRGEVLHRSTPEESLAAMRDLFDEAMLQLAAGDLPYHMRRFLLYHHALTGDPLSQSAPDRFRISEPVPELGPADRSEMRPLRTEVRRRSEMNEAVSDSYQSPWAP